MARTGQTPVAASHAAAPPPPPEGTRTLPVASQRSAAPPSRPATLLVRVTYHEERLRDGVLGLLLQLIPPRVTPDHLTLVRAALAAVGALMWAARAPLRPILALLALAALTDFVDGPLARRRGAMSQAGARLDQLADAVLAGLLGVMALGERLLDRYLVAAMVLPQAASVAASLVRRVELVERPTTLARLQFVLVVCGFWIALLGAALRSPVLVAAGRGLLFAEAGVAACLAALRLGGWYPQRPT